MKKYQLISLIVFVSCNSSVKQPNNVSQKDTSFVKNENTAIIERKDTSDSLKIARIAISFYDWYVHGEKPKDWIPYASMNEDSTISFRNGGTYLGLLEELGTLSERFIKREKERLDECSQYLIDTDWSEADHGKVRMLTQKVRVNGLVMIIGIIAKKHPTKPNW